MDSDSTQRCHKSVIWFALVLVAMAPGIIEAHEGPPFPILMDEPAGNYRVSVWADPDIGEATFFIIVETPEGERPGDVPEVSMWVEPVDGRLDRVNYEPKPMSVKNQLEFVAEPYFDQRDDWTVGFQITSPAGKTRELTTEVESTPPGYGPVDLVIYLFPFVFLGIFWIIAMVRRQRLRQSAVLQENPDHDPETPRGDEPRAIAST